MRPFKVTTTLLPTAQSGDKLVGRGYEGNRPFQGGSVALSADGRWAIVGGSGDFDGRGCAWIFFRADSGWQQYGPKLVGSGATAQAFQGCSVAINADGSAVVIGGRNDAAGAGAIWVFHRVGEEWVQQGEKIVAPDSTTGLSKTFGHSVGISADGNTALVGASELVDGQEDGASWVFVRRDGVWDRDGRRLFGQDASGPARQGCSVALSADGTTALVGGPLDNGGRGAAWVFRRIDGVWRQDDEKLVGRGIKGSGQGSSVALSADGNMAVIGIPFGARGGAACIFVRDEDGWTQRPGVLRGAGAVGTAAQGVSVATSADGRTVLVGGNADDDGRGATWIWMRDGDRWRQQGAKLVGGGAEGAALQGTQVSLCADGGTAMIGGPSDAGGRGAVWAFGAQAAE